MVCTVAAVPKTREVFSCICKWEKLGSIWTLYFVRYFSGGAARTKPVQVVATSLLRRKVPLVRHRVNL